MTAPAGIGHNGGPSMETGRLLRTHQWRAAQRALMPNAIPKLVLQMRLKRAAELGMDYKTYARVRQFSGQDIVGLLFSSNALRILGCDARMPASREEKLQAVRAAQKLALVQPPLSPEAVLLRNPVLDAVGPAPRFTDSWAQARARIEAVIRDRKLSGAQVLVIGEAPLEQEWMAAGRAAAYLPAGEYFMQTV